MNTKINAHLSLFKLFLLLSIVIYFSCAANKPKNADKRYEVELVKGKLIGDPYSSDGATINGGFTLRFRTDEKPIIKETIDGGVIVTFLYDDPAPGGAETSIDCDCVKTEEHPKPKGGCKTDCYKVDGVVVCECVADGCESGDCDEAKLRFGERIIFIQ